MAGEGDERSRPGSAHLVLTFHPVENSQISQSYRSTFSRVLSIPSPLNQPTTRDGGLCYVGR